MAFGKKELILTGVAALTVVCMGGIIGYQAFRSGKSLQQDGYVNWVDDTGEYKKISFGTGTGYKYLYPDKVSLKDQEGKHYQIDDNSFVHYSDGSAGSFSDGFLLDTERMGAGVVQSYYLTAGTMVVGQNGEYAIDNNGAQISLRDFIWRTGEDHYLIAGEGMEMLMPDGSSVTPDGYVEVTYLEDGVVQMIADEQVWTTVAAGAEIDWNGTQLKLDERTIEDENGTRTIVLDELKESDADVVHVSGTATQWSTEHPTWNFTVEDGQNGTDGEAGENGEDGVAGEQGAQGSDGDQGTTGSTGAAGKDGAVGTEGKRGKSAIIKNDSDTVLDVLVQMVSYDATENSVSGKFTIQQGDWDLRNLKLTIQDADTKATKATITFQEESDLSLSQNGWAIEGNVSDTDDEVYEFTFQYGNDLEADKNYRLTLTADYYKEEVNMGNKTFLDRTFFTSSEGISIRQQGISEDSVEVSLKRQKENQALTLILYSSSMGELDRIVTELGDGAGGLETDVTIDGLTSNTTYYIGVENNGTVGEILKITTLKKVPALGTMKAEMGVGYYTLYFDGNVDPDSSIMGYTYDIKDPSQGDHSVKTVDSTKKNGNAKVVFDGEILKYTGDGESAEYSASATVICYDNEKYVRYEVELEDDPNTNYNESVLKISRVYFPTFAPLEMSSGEQKKEVTSTSFKGWFRLTAPGDTKYNVFYGNVEENPLYLMVVANAGDYKEPQVFMYSYKALLTGVETPTSRGYDQPMIKATYDTVVDKGKLYLDVYWDSSWKNDAGESRKLLPDTEYFVYLYGDYINYGMVNQDMSYASGFGLLGSCKFTTPKE